LILMIDLHGGKITSPFKSNNAPTDFPLMEGSLPTDALIAKETINKKKISEAQRVAEYGIEVVSYS